ncbi:tetratricopeptide repeat protein [Kordiimonas pumila]|uniref:Tetratricopeptide repeat protein n=1 Tax=Kordiimonas pumila TaxID=2161677 RepID=A0ABV7D6C0_9PROT|nr:CDC27 family protein [Kordiimonas pumila]
MNFIKTIKSLPMALAAVAIVTATSLTVSGGSAVYAQEEQASQQETRKVPAMSLDIHKKVQKAQEALDLDDVVTAEALLQEALEKRNINDYERAVVWQIKAMISYGKEDTQGTIHAYEQILKYKDSIPVALELNIIYGLAQLYFTEEQYDKALKYVGIWEKQVDPSIISVSNQVFIAQLHYTLGDYKKSLDYLYAAINTAKSLDTVEVKENWYQLALSAHWELNQYDKVRDVLETLLINWPKPLYWIQLAGVYQELGEDKTSYSITEAAYKQGFLDDKEIQLLQMAQIQMAREAPIKCAWVLEKAFKEKRVEQNAKNLRTLGQCYMQANDYKKAIAPLTKSASLDADAALWLQIGQVQMQLDNMKGAVDAFDSAIEGFKKDKAKEAKEKLFTTTMMRGQALTELKRYDDARDAFADASKLADDRRDKKTITQWKSYLKAEEEREKMLTGR